MKYRPGQLVEIVATIDVAPDGTVVQTLTDEYIGKLALVVRYNERNCLYDVLVGNDEEIFEVYEEEVKLVNG
jgi:hypothetical protein